MTDIPAVPIPATAMERLAYATGREIVFGPDYAVLVIEGVVFVAPLTPVPEQREASR